MKKFRHNFAEIRHKKDAIKRFLSWVLKVFICYNLI